MAYAGYRRLRRRFAGRLVNVGERVSALREVKDDRRAAAHAGGGGDRRRRSRRRWSPQGLRGRTEREVAWAVEQAVRGGGAEAVAFATIVAAGPQGALPHAIPGDAAIADGDLVVIDMGARLDGYHSDITRTFAVGPAGERRARRLRRSCSRPSSRALRRCAAASPARAVDAAARGVIEAGRLRRALRSRHGPRRRPRDPREAARRPARPRAARAGHGRHGRARHLPRGPLRRAHRGHGGRSRPSGCERLTLFPKELRVV